MNDLLTIIGDLRWLTGIAVEHTGKELESHCYDSVNLAIQALRAQQEREVKQNLPCYDAEFWGHADCVNTKCPYYADNKLCPAADGCGGLEETEPESCAKCGQALAWPEDKEG